MRDALGPSAIDKDSDGTAASNDGTAESSNSPRKTPRKRKGTLRLLLASTALIGVLVKLLPFLTHDQAHAPADNHSINAGNNTRTDHSINISGSSFGDGTVINNGSGDVNSHNDNRRITITSNVDANALREVLRPKLSPQEFVARYIDLATQRIPDRPSVALHVLSIPGFATNGIEDAAGATLTSLGYHVPALFRAPFAGDGLDKELFRGSAKLASQLQLRQHCDGVLLGEVQIAPANTLQGLFITEATLYLHQIAVDSGAVATNMVIRAKGSGLNADASAANALRELEENIKQQLGKWTLI